MQSYLFLILGFVALIIGAKWLVDGSVGVAKKFGLSELIIGLTIVAMGTSMPELIVNIMSSLNGESDIAIGNVVGSNIVNVLLILGLAAMICKLPIQTNTVLSEIPISIAAILLVGFFANTSLWFENNETLEISKTEGLIIIFFFLLFMSYIFFIAQKEQLHQKAEEQITENFKEKKLPQYIFFILLGIGSLFIGGKWVVDGATDIAMSWGMSKAFIGLTIVAIGTSLPELVTTVIAALNKSPDIGVGNIVGSNIFNLLWILGFTATINPLPFQAANNFDFLVMLLSSTMIILALLVGRKLTLGRWEGAVFVLSYLVYVYFLIQRG